MYQIFLVSVLVFLNFLQISVRSYTAYKKDV